MKRQLDLRDLRRPSSRTTIRDHSLDLDSPTSSEQQISTTSLEYKLHWAPNLYLCVCVLLKERSYLTESWILSDQRRYYSHAIFRSNLYTAGELKSQVHCCFHQAAGTYIHSLLHSLMVFFTPEDTYHLVLLSNLRTTTERFGHGSAASQQKQLLLI